jgi:hypothetical protein
MEIRSPQRCGWGSGVRSAFNAVRPQNVLCIDPFLLAGVQYIPWRCDISGGGKKLANLLIELVKYMFTVIGVGAILPETRISRGTAAVGLGMAAVVLLVALLLTPEEE